MSKVFLKWIGTDGECGLKHGNEYEFLQTPQGYEYVVNERGAKLYTDGRQTYWQRIEREDSTTFEAHGHTWTRHTPGEPMPCGGDAWIYTLLSGNRLGSSGQRYRAQSASWHCKDHKNSDIIGWRFADSAKPYLPGTTADLSEYIECAEDHVSRPIKITVISALAYLVEDESERNDRIAAVDDSTLTPSQRRHWNEMEAKQAAREQLKHDAEAKALQERAEQLSDAGKAMDRVNQDHNHKMGWNHGL